jgi:hypothetical protein
MADAVNMNPNSFTLNWFSIQCTNEKRYLWSDVCGHRMWKLVKIMKEW